MKHHVHQTRNILLIDDDEDDCLLLIQVLTKLSEQMSLICLSDADRLWEVLEECKPCMIVIDFYLPKRNGIEILKMVKEHPGYKDIPVVIWSTSSIIKNVNTAYSTGAQLYLEKPFDYKGLVAALQMIIRMTALREEQTLFTAL
jgi:DNA-binding NtrC family response regulator